MQKGYRTRALLELSALLVTGGDHLRLSNNPYVLITLACQFCSRKGQYRLARLASKYGSEVHMQTVLRYLAGDCEYWRPNHPYKQWCGADFRDLEPPPRPPDLPGCNARAALGKRREVRPVGDPNQGSMTGKVLGTIVSSGSVSYSGRAATIMSSFSPSHIALET